jgi:hypothetical protein
MSSWLSIALGFVTGLILLFWAVFFAVRPFVSARPPKTSWPKNFESSSDANQPQYPFMGDGGV